MPESGLARSGASDGVPRPFGWARPARIGVRFLRVGPKAQAFLALALSATVAQGQEVGPGLAIHRAVELPAQRALMAVVAAAGGRPAQFSTDGCSGGLSAGWERAAELFPVFARRLKAHPPWEACCVAHDAAYHGAGGAKTAEAGFARRLEADLALKACVVGTGEQSLSFTMAETGLSEVSVRQAYKAIAGAMFNAVRLGGGPCTGLPWRWGYGFAGCYFH